MFIGNTDVEAETAIIWPPDVKSWHLKHPDAGKDWGQEEKGMSEHEMFGWYHWSMDMGLLPNAWEFVMDREAWFAVVHGITKSWTWMSGWTELNTL